MNILITIVSKMLVGNIFPFIITLFVTFHYILMFIMFVLIKFVATTLQHDLDLYTLILCLVVYNIYSTQLITFRKDVFQFLQFLYFNNTYIIYCISIIILFIYSFTVVLLI